MLSTVKRLCFSALVLLLVVPGLQARFHWFKEPALDGAYIGPPRASFSTSDLLTNEFQPALELYLEDRLGFRGFLVRLRNQIGYSVFRESWANELAVGRNDVLFEQPFNAYFGLDYVGDENVALNARRFRVVQDSLERHGVQVVFIIAPYKASYMPENLPLSARRHPRTRTNYDAYAEALPAAGVHVIDFSKAFKKWRQTSPYPFFSSGGTHWSMYGGIRAADSLLAYLQPRLKVPPVRFQVAGYEVTTSPQGSDNDIGQTMNLLFSRPAEKLAYPRLTFKPEKPDQSKINVLLTADSFGWTWVNTIWKQAFAAKSRYWYYNSEVAWPGKEDMPEGNDINQLKNRDQYLSRDVIVVMYNERTLATFDNGFSREVYNLFHPPTPADHARYAALVAEFRSKATWEEQVKKDFDTRISAQANAVLDKERLFR